MSPSPPSTNLYTHLLLSLPLTPDQLSLHTQKETDHITPYLHTTHAHPTDRETELENALEQDCQILLKRDTAITQKRARKQDESVKQNERKRKWREWENKVEWDTWECEEEEQVVVKERPVSRTGSMKEESRIARSRTGSFDKVWCDQKQWL